MRKVRSNIDYVPYPISFKGETTLLARKNCSKNQKSCQKSTYKNGLLAESDSIQRIITKLNLKALKIQPIKFVKKQISIKISFYMIWGTRRKPIQRTFQKAIESGL